MISKLFRLFSLRERLHAGLLLVMMIAGAGLETLGIGLIFPFVSLLSNPELMAGNPLLESIRGFLGISSHHELLLAGGCALLGLYLLKNLYLGALAHAQFSFIFGKQAQVSGELFSAYLRAPYVFHLQRNSSELIRNFTTEISGLFTGVIMPLFMLAAEIAVLLAIIAFLIAFEPAITFSLVAAIGFIALVFYFVIGAALRSSSERRSENSKLQIKLVNQGIGSLREIRILGKSGYFQKNFENAARQYADAARTFSTVNVCPRLVLEALAACALVAVVLVTSETGAAVPVLAMFGMATLRIMPSMSRIMSAISSIRFYRPAVDAVLTDLALVRELPSSSDPSAPDDPEVPLEFANKILIEDLSYQYPATEHPAIRHLSAEIVKGSSVAFVGFSGSGKSTLVDLILGLLTPTTGRISVDGSNIQSALPTWQRHFGYVPQTIYLLDDSVRRNIAFGVDDDAIDDSKVWQALEAAHLAKKFREQPDGLNAHVGERGVRLSGGERQRMGIARALFHEPDILVFDEATSALDNQTEREVAETINALRSSKTLIIVAHRLSTIINCDRIYFMKSGSVVDSGTFEELVTRSVDFRKMIGQTAEPSTHPAG